MALPCCCSDGRVCCSWLANVKLVLADAARMMATTVLGMFAFSLFHGLIGTPTA